MLLYDLPPNSALNVHLVLAGQHIENHLAALLTQSLDLLQGFREHHFLDVAALVQQSVHEVRANAGNGE